MKTFKIITAVLVLALIIAGCEQSPWNAEELGDQITLAEEEVASLKSAEATESDVDAAKFAGLLMNGGMTMRGHHLLFGRNFPPCATVTVDSDEYPKTITVEYAEECVGRMGMAKNGTITIEMSDTITNEGAVYKVTFSNVNFGERTIEKTVTYTNEGQNDAGNWVISYEMLSTTSCTKEEEAFVIVRDFAGSNEWLAGFDTPECADDQFLRNATGTISVSDTISESDDLTFESTVTDLYIDRACKYPLSGVIDITREDESMSIDFGTGECDNIALVTKDGESEEIELNAGKFRKGFKRNEHNMKTKKGWW